MKPQIEVFEDKKELARYFGEYLVQLSNSNNPVTVALSGGSTPKAIFEVLSHEFAQRIDWSNLLFFWGDERCVAPNDQESNFGMTREHLFDYVNAKSDNIFRVKGELSPEEATDEYITQVEDNVPFANELPQFDLMVLGMGDDGHTASIFPYQIGLWESENTCELAQHPDSGQFRVTLSGKVINNARQIFFLVTGASKAEKAKEIISKTGNYQSYPAALVDTSKSLWLMDKAAAKLL